MEFKVFRGQVWYLLGTPSREELLRMHGDYSWVHLKWDQSDWPSKSAPHFRQTPSFCVHIGLGYRRRAMYPLTGLLEWYGQSFAENTLLYWLLLGEFAETDTTCHMVQAPRNAYLHCLWAPDNKHCKLIVLKILRCAILVTIVPTIGGI